MTMQTTTRQQRISPPPKPPPHLARLSHLIERALDRALPPRSQSPAIIHEAMRYCVMGSGKRFRPLLCLAACEAVGARAAGALPAACAIELIHTYSLVHDDLPAMDNAALRRGKPSCHRRFGEGHAILIGDALLTYAVELLSRQGRGDRLAVIRTISRACGTAGLIGGQALDLQCGARPPRHGSGRGSAECGVGQLTAIARQKTGALITASVEAGGLAGGATSKQLQRLRKYGHNMGLAFQLIDDVHDQDGLARAMGMGPALRQAHRAIDGAVCCLEPFGTRADGLRDLALWLASTA